MVGGSKCRCRRGSSALLWAVLVPLLTLIVHTYGGCEFKKEWEGKWFINGVPTLLTINSSWIESKGVCEENLQDKYLVHDLADDCYRCMVIHEKHDNVLQYKETYCDRKQSLESLCNEIAGDASLYSMFRVEPRVAGVPCPFKTPPFTFTYSRGIGECGNPVSRVDSCTDESRLSFKYQACPDVHGTESAVEELQCLALWKDGNTRYMVGKLNHHRASTDEDSYRCFVYEKVTRGHSGVVYNVAQSGDATCNGLTTALEGSKTIKLTKVDAFHTRCKYPSWITDHHRWHTLDHRKSYHFSHKNATLKITEDAQLGMSRGEAVAHGAGNRRQSAEMRVVCHAEVPSDNNRTVIIAHVTSGCESGYMCVAFYRRDVHVIEYQQSASLVHQPEDACSAGNFNPQVLPYTTLITGSLPQRECPHLGKYNVVGQTVEGRSVVKRDIFDKDDGSQPADMKDVKKAVTGTRQKRGESSGDVRAKREGLSGDVSNKAECNVDRVDSVAVGCSTAADTMEFHSNCNHDYNSVYSCYGSWEENGTHYLIAGPQVARKSNEARWYCFVSRPVYERGPAVAQAQLGPTPGALTTDERRPLARLMMSAVAGTCDRAVNAGLTGIRAFNLTIVGECRHTPSSEGTPLALPSVVLCCALLALAVTTR